MEATGQKGAAGTAGPSEKASFGVSAPSISLPKGGGAIRGIGEKLGANPVTGTGSMSVPIATSPGRSGFGPQLALSYDSGAGNGPFGFGWSLSLPSITRKTDKGLPHYRDAEESDVFLLSGAEDLVPVLVEQGGKWVREPVPDRSIDTTTYKVQRYRPRIEGLFARIERWTRNDGEDCFWRSISRDNVTTLYGRTEDSRIADPADSARIFTWLICESYDAKGNAIVFDYAKEDSTNVDTAQANERNRTADTRKANRYVKRIKYGNKQSRLDHPDYQQQGWHFQVVFDYEEGHSQDVSASGDDPSYVESRATVAGPPSWPVRPDPFSTFRAGFEVRTYRLCRRVLMFHDFNELGVTPCLVRSTELTYEQGPVASFITSVTQSGCVRQRDANESFTDRYLKRSLPPVEFNYSKVPTETELPLLPVRDIDTSSLENLPIGLDGAQYQWVDLDGEGISGVLTEQLGTWYYKENLGKGFFAPQRPFAGIPALAENGGNHHFLDLAGDGQLDVVMYDAPTPGFYERTLDASWESFRVFDGLPNVAWRDPNLKFIDLSGDGHSDLIISENDTFVWHASLAEEGFAPAERVTKALDEEKGPKLVFADVAQSIFLADMSGDGLTDIVRIRNGEVCYWPNLGYGRFGAKVTMDQSPWFDAPDIFDSERIRLADTDGSGVTDIMYLRHDGPRLYFNQSGNGWSSAVTLAQFPRVDHLATVQVFDLLGTGTACLVWSSPLPGNAPRQMRYVDLMGGVKPHLLVQTVNNLGAETRAQYASSTQFYLKDKRDGKPWITRLPFAVQVVDRVETYDRISRNRFVTRYAYHHGYFDGVEREFRGFGMVEQRDTEEFASLSANDAVPVSDNIDAASHVPPVLTKTWFHTGVYLGRERVSNFFAGLLDDRDVGEYYRQFRGGDAAADAAARALLLDDTILPGDLTFDEEREACRALKGSMLRQEVYSLDGTPKQDHPYTVTEQNVTIERLQPRANNRHSVFFVHAREAINYHYERNPADPRVSHALTLEVDPFGNVLKAVAIGYGRGMDAPDAALLPEDREKQRLIHITCTENEFTTAIVNQVEVYCTPLPAQSRTYEVRKPQQEKSRNGPSQIHRFEDVRSRVNQAGDGAHDIDYEDIEFTKARQAVVNDASEANKYFRRLIEHVRTLYRPDDLGAAQDDPLRLLPLKTAESMALPGESYKLAFTLGLLDQVYVRGGQKLLPPSPANVLAGGGADRGGYVELDNNGFWWVPSGRIFYSLDSAHTAALERDYARRHFYLPHRYRDPFHTNAVRTEGSITYDGYDLLMVESRDCVGNRVTVGERDALGNLTVPGNDYRVLQPKLVMDPNRNRAQVAFDALGMVAGTAVMGKPLPAPVEGDSLAGFAADLTQAQIDAFYNAADPHTVAPATLQNATTRIVYDFDRFRRTQAANPADKTKWLPPYAATLARETHASDPRPPFKIQIGFTYSDGFGREIQKKIQAEPEKNNDVVGPPRWVGSGWTIFNNKGNPVRQYEPFFSQLHPAERHHFEFGVRVGVSPILFYDPAKRVVATLHPNHTYEKVLFDPWQQTIYDVNDTLKRSGAAASPFDPRNDPHVGHYLARLPDDYYLPTWYDVRTDAAKALLAWPDSDAQGRPLPDSGKRRAAEKIAAEKAVAHADTPSTAHFDALGRPFLTLARSRVVCTDHPLDGTEAEFATRIELDIEGNQRAVRDANKKYLDAEGNEVEDEFGHIVMRYAYDLLGNRIYQLSMEGGARWTLNDVVGEPIRAWDSRGQVFRIEYDRLRRPLRSHVMSAAANPNQELLVERLAYGEQHPEDELRNLRGKLYLHLAQVGAVTTEAHDFKGNPLRASRRVATEYKMAIDWRTVDAVLPVDAAAKLNAAALEAAFVSHVEADTYISSTTYDALNRPVTLITPHTPAMQPNVIRRGYNEGNLLERVDANLHSATANGLPVWTPFVTNVDYDAKGQRTVIDYGNRVRTTYDYDPLTFRLVNLSTARYAVTFPDDCPQTPPAGWPGCQVQNLHFTCDPAGNITHIQDDAQQTIYFKNQRVEPSNDYTYDAIYRLIEATGREHVGQVGAPIPHSYNDAGRTGLLSADASSRFAPNDGNAMDRYCEKYMYDAVGNVVEMSHHRSCPAAPSWKRTYTYAESSLIEPAKQTNRLSSTAVGNNSPIREQYGHDVHGNMLRMPQLQVMQWDYKDQLQMTQRQKVNNEDNDVDERNGERTCYVYDAAGQRVRKVTELANGAGLKDERIYLGGIEIYRKHSGNAAGLVRETLHIMDDKQRIGLVETRSAGNDGSPRQLIRYQFGNHLGSASLELDDQAQIITYEEYAPYGSTSYQAVRSQKETAKRYRYTGKERDEENGLHYHGARYYAAWIARWVSVDPILSNKEGGPKHNGYFYADDRPLAFVDPTGRDIAVRPESKLTATQFVEAIKSTEELPLSVRDAFSVKKKDKTEKEPSLIVVSQAPYHGKGEQIPEWFESIQRAAAQNEWELTTGTSAVTGSGSTIKADTKEEDHPGYPILGDKWVKEDYVDTKSHNSGVTLAGREWKLSQQDPDASDKRRVRSRSDKGLIVVALKLTVSNPSSNAPHGQLSTPTIAKTLIHELALHAGRLSGPITVDKKAGQHIRMPSAHGDALVDAWLFKIDELFKQSPVFREDSEARPTGGVVPEKTSPRPKAPEKLEVAPFRREQQ